MGLFRIIMILMFFSGFGCTTVKVSTDVHKDFSLLNYSTYDYRINGKDQNDSVKIFEDEINFLKDILDDRLNSYSLTQDKKPELLIYIGYVPDDKYTLTKDYEIKHAGDIRSALDRGDLVGAYYQMGALTLDIVDMNKNQVVFSLTATNTLRKNEKKNRERIESAVERMFLDMSKK